MFQTENTRDNISSRSRSSNIEYVNLWECDCGCDHQEKVIVKSNISYQFRRLSGSHHFQAYYQVENIQEEIVENEKYWLDEDQMRYTG